jgi:hypothetical protein
VLSQAIPSATPVAHAPAGGSNHQTRRGGASVLVILVLVATLFAAGCSGSDATTTTMVAPTTSSTVVTGGADLMDLLEPKDVQLVSGKAGVARAGRNPDRRLGGDLNFVFENGRPLLMVVVEPADRYEDWKADPDSFREEVAGIGEAAFIGPNVDRNQDPYLLVFRSGDYTVGLLTYDDETADGWSNLVTMEQMEELAGIIIGRL